MPQNNRRMNRKSFFRKLGVGVGAVTTANAFGSTSSEIEEDLSLTEEQKAFLTDYKAWLAEFKHYIELRNQNVDDFENNKRLMDLSMQAKEWNLKLRDHMTDDKYYAYYLDMTKEVTSMIA